MDLITQRIPLSKAGWEDHEAVVKQLEKEHECDLTVAELVRKGIIPEDVQFKDGERSSVDYITTRAVDRDREIVVPRGAVLDHYRSHPVVLFGHDYRSLPVGKNLWIKTDEKGVIAKTKYANTEKANEIWEYRKSGFPLAKSIGFVPLETVEEKDFGTLDLKKLGLEEGDLKGAARIYPKWLLLEYSDVPIPSNPEALQVAISKGLWSYEEVVDMVERGALCATKEMVEQLEKPASPRKTRDLSGDWREYTEEEEFEEEESEEKEEDEDEDEIVTKPETTDNYHHIPIRAKGDFVSGSFRTIDISAEQGIKAVIGKLKSDPQGPTKTQKYMFDVDKWSMEEAKKWVQDHKDAEPGEEKKEEDKKTADEALPDVEEEPPALANSGTAKTIDEKKGFHTVALLDDNGEAIQERWNLTLSKAFDVVEVELKPSSIEYDIVSKYLDCKVKEIFQNEKGIPSAMIGNYLSALKEITRGFELKDVRNFSYGGTESPPVSEVIRLNSEKEDDLLINGMSFYVDEQEMPLVTHVYPTFHGMNLIIYTPAKNKSNNKELLRRIEGWVREHNLLKGEAFALSGEFLKRGDDSWDDIFLSAKNEDALARSVSLLNKKGAEMSNRGLLLMGPPGTGKTMSGRVMMKNTDATFIWVSSRDFFRSGPIGGMRYAFGLARDLAPTILFVEDIDHWLGDVTCDLLKTEMDGLQKYTGVVTVLTSNYPEKLPDALIDRPGRFHDVLYFILPDIALRHKMLGAWTELETKELDPLVKRTRGFSGAHLFELVSFAKTLAAEGNVSFIEALMQSLEKIDEQRRLIEDVRADRAGEAEKEMAADAGQEFLEIDDFEDTFDIKEPDNTMEVDIAIDGERASSRVIEPEAKAGRVISAKNRGIIQKAITSMDAATVALKELLEATEVKPPEEEKEEEGHGISDAGSGKELDLDIEEEDESGAPDIDLDKVAAMLRETAAGIVASIPAIDLGQMVGDKIKVAQGRVI